MADIDYDKPKPVHIQLDEGFEDEDLLSEDEKDALKAEIEGEEEDRAGDDAAADAEAKKAAEDAKTKEDAEKAKEADDAKAKEDADAKAIAEAEERAKLAKEDDAGKAADPPKPAAEEAKIVPAEAPPASLKGLSAEELTQVTEGLADVKKQFQEGAIDYDTYLDQRDEFNRQIWQNDLAEKMNVDSVETRWEWEQESFLTAEENKWINADDVVYSAFAATVNRLMGTEEGAVLPGPELLDQARTEVAARFSPTHQKDTQTADEDKAKAEALRRAKGTEAAKDSPETLAGKPMAEQDEGSGEFEWIDKLEGEAYEQAVEGLTDQQLKRYEG
jgi:hypothetical protein